MQKTHFRKILYQFKKIYSDYIYLRNLKTKPLKSNRGRLQIEQFTLNKANQIERASFGNCVRAIMTHDEADKGSSASEADQ